MTNGNNEFISDIGAEDRAAGVAEAIQLKELCFWGRDRADVLPGCNLGRATHALFFHTGGSFPRGFSVGACSGCVAQLLKEIPTAGRRIARLPWVKEAR